jgi:hypothetical protein
MLALQVVLLEEPPVVLVNIVPVVSLHEGVPQQQREAVMVQTSRAQPAVLKGAVRVIFHLRQDFCKIRFYDERYSTSTAKDMEKDNKGGD